LCAAEAGASTKASSNYTCEESPSRIAEPAHQREKNAQLKDLERGVASCRVDELRQKCQEKQGGLGIEQIDEHALSKDAAEPSASTKLRGEPKQNR